MFALAVEYGPDPPSLALRWRYRDLLAGLSGYRRRLELQADGYRRLVEVFLFASPEATEAALVDEGRQAFVDAHPACGATSSSRPRRWPSCGEGRHARARPAPRRAWPHPPPTGRGAPPTIWKEATS